MWMLFGPLDPSHSPDISGVRPVPHVHLVHREPTRAGAPPVPDAAFAGRFDTVRVWRPGRHKQQRLVELPHAMTRLFYHTTSYRGIALVDNAHLLNVLSTWYWYVVVTFDMYKILTRVPVGIEE